MSLLQEGKHVWRGLHSKEITSKISVHRDQEAAQTLLGPGQSQGLGEKKGSRHCFPEQRHIGAVANSPRRVYFSRMHLTEDWYMPLHWWGIGAELVSYLSLDWCRTWIHGISTCNELVHEGEHFWNGIQAKESTSNQAVHRVEVQTIYCFGIGNVKVYKRKKQVLLSWAKMRWGCCLFPEESWSFQNTAPILVLCHFIYGP